MLKPLAAACACAFLLAATAFAQIQQAPAGAQLTPPRLPPNAPAPQITTPCAPDLAVRSVTLTKGGLGQLSITAEAFNVGRGDWVAASGLHAISWQLHNRASGQRFGSSTPLPPRIAESALAGSVSTGVINNA
jgi:hypothetical protein